MGYVSTLCTKIEQIMCSRGYSDQVRYIMSFEQLQTQYQDSFQLSGLAGSLIFLMGFLASFPIGILAYKTNRPITICKLFGLGSIGSLGLLCYFLRLPDVGVGIVTSCAMLGIFALGCYPLAMELMVECTYPVDQAIGAALILLSSAFQGVLLMQVNSLL